MADARPTYRLTFTATKDPVPTICRLKRLLKTLLRVYGFRCIEVIELPADVPAIGGQVEVPAPLP